MPSPLRGVPPQRGVNPYAGPSRARDGGGCSAAQPRPRSAEGAGPGIEPGEQQRGSERGASDPGLWQGRVPPARAELLRAFAEHFGDSRRFSHRHWGKRLDRVLDRLDRYAHFGAGREGAGLDYASALIEAAAEECRWRRGASRPQSLAYFIPLLEEVSKRWRRYSADRVDQVPAGWRESWANPKRKKNAGAAGGTATPANDKRKGA